jgi:hypothetical protein
MKPLLVISSARCVWDDIEKVRPILSNYDTLGVNKMIPLWPGQLDHAVSWHFDSLHAIVEVRTYRKLKNRPITYGPKTFKGVDNVGRFDKGSIMTSGMYAVHVALHLGYEKIVLAGIPFDDTGHFYDPPQDHPLFIRHVYRHHEHHYARHAEKAWIKVNEKANNRVRAISGNLIDCFGEVTEDWLKS